MAAYSPPPGQPPSCTTQQTRRLQEPDETAVAGPGSNASARAGTSSSSSGGGGGGDGGEPFATVQTEAVTALPPPPSLHAVERDGGGGGGGIVAAVVNGSGPAGVAYATAAAPPLQPLSPPLMEKQKKPPLSPPPRKQHQPPAFPAAPSPPAPSWSSRQRLVMTLIMPLLALYCTAAFVVAWLSTFFVVPSYILAQRLYWACPFIPYIWRRLGPVAGTTARFGFEASHCINILTRLLTLPLRPYLPSFYILGFPKCGTTSLAEYLKTHPGLSATAGLPYHEALAKESHFFQERIRRLTPKAKIIVMFAVPNSIDRYLNFRVQLRDPVPGVFSAEIMMRDMGVPLEWTLSDPVEPNDPRFAKVW
ncbi:hypothetical protein VOLCADRAFT_87176 [Volvox carteri f. nagariensis]|uniref:Sulfotransferase n=1 Tax=Volvox carteri f. nagariensis TaxID=3068 RepID=D8TKD6_VOLCA|nr:uncharacterized protein VOLCADRAFT_87176 [Volvox carteri f. nagariensis]EFJ52044.1 hypothetical protein VOLCADRAFT_87176 [Volvox carteri f. nagariensis]|eukprot:XP_002946818.1 hypothetical protein VOLCADRAFT_87176 [Volvox carteri f. nagariensis]